MRVLLAALRSEDGSPSPARAGRIKAARERKRPRTGGAAAGCGLEAAEHAGRIEMPRSLCALRSDEPRFCCNSQAAKRGLVVEQYLVHASCIEAAQSRECVSGLIPT